MTDRMPHDHSSPTDDDTARTSAGEQLDTADRRPPRARSSNATPDRGARREAQRISSDHRSDGGEANEESRASAERRSVGDTNGERRSDGGNDRQHDEEADERGERQSESGDREPGATENGDGAVGERFGSEEPARAAEPTDPEESAIPATSSDKLFELLASPGNRYVLTYLLRANSPAALGDLVEYVLEATGPPAESTPAKFRGRVASQLRHENLPALEAAGLVEYDADEQLVAARPAIDDVAPYLDLALAQATRAREE